MIYEISIEFKLCGIVWVFSCIPTVKLLLHTIHNILRKPGFACAADARLARPPQAPLQTQPARSAAACCQHQDL